MQSACLQVPLVLPQDSQAAWAKLQQASAQQAQSQPATAAANAPLQDNH